MAFRMNYTYTLQWVPDGAGASPAPTGFRFRFPATISNNIPAPVTLGSSNGSPTVAQITAALAVAQADILAQMTAQPILGQMQAVPTGGPYS